MGRKRKKTIMTKTEKMGHHIDKTKKRTSLQNCWKNKKETYQEGCQVMELAEISSSTGKQVVQQLRSYSSDQKSYCIRMSAKCHECKQQSLVLFKYLGYEVG